MPAQIPRTAYHPPSKKPLILSLNKYTHFRIILEISLQNNHQNYFPELLNPNLTILDYYVIIYYGARNNLLAGATGRYVSRNIPLDTPSIVLQCKNKPKIAFKMPTYQITHGTY